MQTYQNLDEIVFEDREKRYGAYLLRHHYVRFLSLATAFLMGLLGIGISLPKVFGKYFATNETPKLVYNDPKLHNLPTKEKELAKELEKDVPTLPKLPDMPEPPKVEVIAPTPKVETISFKVPEPKPQTELKEDNTIVSNEQTQNKVVSTTTNTGATATNSNFIPTSIGEKGGYGNTFAIAEEPEPTPTAKSQKPEPDKEDEDPKEGVWTVCQKRPQPVNLQDIREKIGYPPIAKDGGIEGQVLLSILVDEEGKYKKHIVKSSIHPLLLKAVEQHVANLRFTPAIQSNKAIPFWVIVPFKFELKQ